MAIYHLHAKVLQRSKGRNVVAAAAYRRADKLFDDQEQRAWDYRKKPDVIHSELIVPADAPEWLQALVTLHATHPSQAAETLWNKVAAAEKRVDSQLARDIEFALPMELSIDQNIILAREFIHDQFVLRGMVADWSVHWDAGNPHVHVLLTMRELTPTGLGKRVLLWNNKALLYEWRKQWGQYANFHLRLHQHDITIDHRSYRDQGIDLIPTLHQGKAVRDMERRGMTTDLMMEAHRVDRDNLTRIAAQPSILLHALSKQSSTFTGEQVGQALGRYLTNQDRFSSQEKNGERASLTLEAGSSSASAQKSSLNHSGILADALLQTEPALRTSVEESAVLTVPPVLTPEAITTLLKSIEHHESVFTEREIAKAVAPYTQPAELFARAMIQLKASPELIALGPGDDGRDRFTTRRMFQLENTIQKSADILRHRPHFNIAPQRIYDILEAHQNQIGKRLEPEQMEAVHHILQPSSIRCLVGRAGTGKSFLLGMAKAVWEQHGLRVQGIALSGIAADGLNKEAGMTSRTIESFRYALSQGTLTLDAHDVVVMDEAGMTDSVSMMAVLDAVQTARAKLVLVGDPAQLQPVGPGASFRVLIERLDFKEIQTVYRQQIPWQNEATVAFSRGHLADGLAAYEAHGCLHFEKTAEEALSNLVQDWLTTRDQTILDLSHYLVVAHRNEDVNALNRLLRAQRIHRGEIAEGYPVHTQRGDIHIASGDRLLFLKNDRQLGVSNGRFATVKTVDFTKSGRVLPLTVRLDDTDQDVRVDPAYYAELTYGYAATVHKTQGMTVDHTFVYAGGLGWNRHLTYVALSRHRQTCHLYADATTHHHRSTLQRRLSRLGMKDSVLDFPLAFTERRGLDTTGLLHRLPTHLAQRLTAWTARLSTPVESWLDPVGYQRRLDNQARESLEREAITLRREDAKVVAAYVDGQRAVGVAWQALQTRLQGLGLDKVNDTATFSVRAGLPEYALLQQAVQARDAKAGSLMQDLSRYTGAIDQHSLDVNAIKAQAERHACCQRVTRYLSERQRGAVVPRDRLAADMMPTMKQHYTYLKTAGVSGQELKQHAMGHRRRQLFKTLTVAERMDFKVVEQYHTLTRQVGAQWALLMDQQAAPRDRNAMATHSLGAFAGVKHSDQPATALPPVRRSQLQRVEDLSQQRDQLAHWIVQERTRFATALSFYHIGHVVLQWGEQLTAPLQQQAQTREFRLQQQATRFALRERVEAYHRALLVGDLSTRRSLAQAIVQEAKAHHGAVVGLGANTVEVWRAIRLDAKHYDQQTYYRQLDPAARTGFRVVAAYVLAKQAHTTAWREVLAADSSIKRTVHRDEKRGSAQVASQAARYTHRRNQLAAQMVANPSMYAAGLHYFHITVDELQPQAYAHQCRMQVDHYVQAGTGLPRAHSALNIIKDPKAHHPAVLEQGLSWRTLYQQARWAERHALFAILRPEEKIVHRLADRYRLARQYAGQLLSRLKTRAQGAALSNPDTARIDVAFARRDYLAWRFVKTASRLEVPCWTDVIGLTSVYRLKVKTLLQQQAAHTELLMVVARWQEKYQTSLQAVQSVHAIHVQGLDSPGMSHAVQHAIRVINEALQMQKIERLHPPDRLRYALGMSGGSIQTLVQQMAGLTALKEPLQAWVRCQPLDLQQRLDTSFRSARPMRSAQSSHSSMYQRMDLHRLREQLKARASEVAQQYLGDPKIRQGNVWRYGSHQGSLVVNVGGAQQGLWHDFQTGLGGDLLSLIQQSMETVHFKAVLEEATRFVGGYSTYPTPQRSLLLDTTRPMVSQAMEGDAHTVQKIQKAQAIVQASQPITGTLAERYLREHRGITLALPDQTFRYHPNLKNWMTGDRYPALIVVARDEKEHVCGVQAIFLEAKTAKKAALGSYTKLSRGLIGEGARVHAGLPFLPADRVAFAEGVETALSVAQARPDWTVYTTFGVANFDKVPLKVKRPDILLCVDQDGRDSATARGVERAAHRLAQKGLNVWVAEPHPPDSQQKWDFNEALQQQGLSQVQSDLDQATLYKTGITADTLLHQLSTTLETLTEGLLAEKEVQQTREKAASLHPTTTRTPTMPDPQPGRTPDLSFESVSYEALLLQYVEMELEQTRLTQAMHLSYIKDPQATRALASQVMAHSQQLEQFAREAVQRLDIKADIETIKNEFMLPHLAERGGFKAIAERMKQGNRTPEDVKVVVNQLNQKALERSRAHVRDRNRGGRSR